MTPTSVGVVHGAPRISAIVVTRNRAGYLEKALGSLLSQRLERDAYEVIVVDNGSTDGTRALVEGLRGQHTNVRYVFEGREGSSRARNAGVAVAAAPLVAYLDDDAIASPDWLAALLTAFERCDPTPSCIGGKILPLWEEPPPAWFPRRYLPSLSMLDKGDETQRLPDGDYIVGANMAFVKDDVVAAGGFNDDISLYADEICMQDRIRRRGGAVYYVPDAWVHHHVPAGRLTVAYLRQRKYRGGKGELAVVAERQRGAGLRWLLWKNVLGRPVHVARLYVLAAANGLIGRPEQALDYRVQLSRSAGMWVQATAMLCGRRGVGVRA